MSASTRAISVMTIGLLAACDPVVSMNVHQRLAPSPSLGCVTTAVATSRAAELDSPDATQQLGALRLMMRDTSSGAGATSWRSAWLTIGPPSDSGSIVSLSQTMMLFAIPADHRAWFAGVAGDLLASVRAACAPATTAPRVCEYRGHEKSCAPAA